MANIYTARQLLSGPNAGKWHYTCGSDEDSRGMAYPVGGCAENCPGHDTPEAARQHYEDWIVEHCQLNQGSEADDTRHRCEHPGCEAFTHLRVDGPAGHWYYRAHLFPAHNNAESFRAAAFKKRP